MPEHLDIFDANFRQLGKKSRAQAHFDGDWHQAIHCWVVSRRNNNGALLFSKRSRKMSNFSGLLDVTCSGHISAGESVADGIREVREELGIEIDISECKSLGRRMEACDMSNGDRNREFQSVFFAVRDDALDCYMPDTNEVEGLFWLNIEEAISFFAGEAKAIAVDGIEFSPNTNRWNYTEDTITKDHFRKPRTQYFLLVAIMANRLLRGQHILTLGH